MVIVPGLPPVTKPDEGSIVATEPLVPVELMFVSSQATFLVSCERLLLLSVPQACMDSVLPTATEGVGGCKLMLCSLGFGQKPVQLTAKASIARAAKAPMRRS